MVSKRPRIVILGGGFGAVSAARPLERIFAGRARDTRLEQTVAIKVLPAHFADR